MSIRIMAQLWERSRLGGTELLCLLAIADFANDAGIAFPSVSTLAAKIRMSKRNTNYLLKRIEQSGELAIERNAGPKGCNLFRVQILHCAEFAGMQPIASGGATGSSKGVQPIAPEPSLNHQEPPLAQKPSAQHKKLDDDSFGRFWKTYPKKKSKGVAEKVWRAIKPDEHLADRILQAVEHAKTSDQWQKNAGQFIPYPATWLNAKGWEDETSDTTEVPVWERT